ncbi:MAG: hypothetical protein E6X17_08095 [Sporomusaceae bacterium]|nr:hypothetical protein [Sporomusaceae bacterium]
MDAVQKAAVILLLLGLEKGGRIMQLMDTDEVRRIIAAWEQIRNLPETVQQSVWSEFIRLGYDESMKPAEALWILRQFFAGSRIRSIGG